jgi:hypothetical protein
MYGIKELKELLTFGFKLQKAIAAVGDGKINVIVDAPKFLPALLAAPKAFGGIGIVLAEIKDLDEAERLELLAFVREEFDLSDDRLEELIEDTLGELLSLFKLAQRFAALRKT